MKWLLELKSWISIEKNLENKFLKNIYLKKNKQTPILNFKDIFVLKPS
jgi:hypothetical protein